MSPTSLCKGGFKDVLKFKAKLDSVLLAEYVVLLTRLNGTLSNLILMAGIPAQGERLELDDL